MHLRNALSLGIAAVGLAAISLGSASAQAPISIVGSTGLDQADNVFWNPTTGLTINNLNAVVASTVSPTLGVIAPSTISFTPLAPVSFTLNGTAFIETLGPGSFTVTGPNPGGPVLLMGSFGNSILTGNIGSTSGGVNLVTNSVTYDAATPGTLFPGALGYIKTGGSLSLTFTGQQVGPPPTLNSTGDGLNTFEVHDSVVWAAVKPNAVPEPGAVALLSSLAVCGSAFGLRRLRRTK